MNEERLEELLHGYRDSLGVAKRPAAGRSSSGRRLVLVGGLVVAVLGATVFWPRDVGAAALHQLELAIRNAKSMESDLTLYGKHGAMDITKISYREGAWRYDSRINTGKHVVIIRRDGKVLTEFPKLGYATIEPATESNSEERLSGTVDALEYVKNLSQSGTPTTTTKQNRNDGTYLLRIEGKEDGNLTEIVVNEVTDLPVSAKVRTLTRSPSRYVEQTYRFDVPLPEERFALTSKMPIIESHVEQGKLRDLWKKPLASLDTSDVRCATVTQDGTIWIAVTAPEEAEPALPSSLQAESSPEYVRSAELTPGVTNRKLSDFRVDGKRVWILGFSPIHAPAEQPGQIRLSFSRRKPYLPTQPHNEELKEKTVGAVELTLKPELSALPSYFSALQLDWIAMEMPILLTTWKARYLEKQDRWQEAARMYEQCAEAHRNYIARGAFIPLHEASRCYRKAGMQADADRTEAQSKELRDY